MPRTDAATSVPAPATASPADVAGEASGLSEVGTQPADPRTEEILRRLKSVEGHVRGVQRMVAEDAYCMDVMNQILAIERALKKVSGMVLDRHLHTCVTRALRGDDPEERERVIEEVMEVFQASGRR